MATNLSSRNYRATLIKISNKHSIVGVKRSKAFLQIIFAYRSNFHFRIPDYNHNIHQVSIVFCNESFEIVISNRQNY